MRVFNSGARRRNLLHLRAVSWTLLDVVNEMEDCVWYEIRKSTAAMSHFAMRVALPNVSNEFRLIIRRRSPRNRFGNYDELEYVLEKESFDRAPIMCMMSPYAFKRSLLKKIFARRQSNRDREKTFI